MYFYMLLSLFKIKLDSINSITPHMSNAKELGRKYWLVIYSLIKIAFV